ncbi:MULTISPECIES: PLDc N-terminal domain-containing protein [Nocardiopsis]|uniref:PLDc N-terminal domain-containing protein n=1 Tax=Nocardiopsis TaxID=2013 RepID=UPI0003497FF5|nr:MULTISPECIES: PLDc N-terminal domain-containing protein [Nocardiopsis]PWV55263.1 phospholipase D-like protein [Nocardiopsis sp. L17-MgMaSL7]
MTLLNLFESMTPETGIALALMIGALLVGLAAIVLIVAAVFSILFSRLDVPMKLVWIVLVFLAPLIGALLWFLIGRNRVPAQRYGYR